MIGFALTMAIVLAGSSLRADGGVHRAGWLAGCWEMRVGGRVTHEMWMTPSGGLMIGVGRTTVRDTLREYEHLRLHAEGDTLVYTALPSRQRETAFRSVSISDTALVFENLAHDFPQRIEYRRRGADSLRVRIEGPGPKGVRGVDYRMRRVACEGAGRAADRPPGQ